MTCTCTGTQRHTRVMQAAIALLTHRNGAGASADDFLAEMRVCVSLAYALEAVVESGIPASPAPVEGKF